MCVNNFVTPVNKKIYTDVVKKHGRLETMHRYVVITQHNIANIL